MIEKKKTPTFLDLGPAMEYPHVSRISSEDHKWLILEYEKLLSEQMDKIDSAKVRKLQELKTQVMEEQEQFQQFVFHHARFNCHLYNFINPEVLTSVKNIQQFQRVVISKNYPQYYTLQQTVGLAVGAAYPSDPVMKFEKMLLQRGEVPRLVIPEDESFSTLSLTKTFSPTLSGAAMGAEMQALSKDQIAVTLAKAHGASVVISSEAFMTLVQSQQSGFQQQWDLPIIVQEHNEEGNDVKKVLDKVVFLEEPLPKLSLTPKEVNDIYFKRALTETCSKLRKRSHSQSTSISVSGILQKNFEGEAKNEQNSSSRRPRIEESDNLSCGSDVMQTELGKTKGIGEILSNDKNKPQNATATAKNKVVTESANLVKDNSVYNLWTFGKLRILICCSLEGYKEISQKPLRFEYYSIFPKLEYQPTFGHERLTPTETARMWAHAFIRPNTKILCGRINRYSSAILRIDELEIGDVLNAGDGFNPAHAMKMVYKVLESLISLPEGEYLLSHSSGDIHSCLYKSAPADCHSTSQEKRAMLDLYSRYEGDDIKILSYKEKEIPFSRIDTNLFLPINIEQNRFAATFPAVPARELEKMKKDIHGISEVSRKGKKKKGKKKKKKSTAAAEKRANSEGGMDHLTANRNEQDACADKGESDKCESGSSVIGPNDSSLLEQSLSRRAIKRAHRVILKANLGDMDLPKEQNSLHLEEMRQRDAVSYTDLDDF